MSTENVELRPAQCRAARALLNITQPQLARLAGLGLSTVVDFEKEWRQVSAAAVETIQRALRAGQASNSSTRMEADQAYVYVNVPRKGPKLFEKSSAVACTMSLHLGNMLKLNRVIRLYVME